MLAFAAASRPSSADAQGSELSVAQRRGAITMQSYRSALSELEQHYAIYLPKDYDPAKKYPLMITLHGGSSNGNLFLGVVLGNNMDWKKYPQHLYDTFKPRFFPDWIVVAPDGYGQVIWRWMGEQDVIDVVTDVRKRFSVDEDRICLVGLSNGGMGAHSIGLRHAHLFNAVVAIAGAPSWLMYTGGKPSPEERLAMQRLSAFDLAENAWNTDYRIFHGRTDPGPMRPAYSQAYEDALRQKGVPHRMTWFNAGHDILYMAFRQGKLFETLAQVKRKKHPEHVVVVSGDYRAAKQHWLSLTRIDRYPELGRAEGVVRGNILDLKTRNVSGLAIVVAELPKTFVDLPQSNIFIDGAKVFSGALAHANALTHLSFVKTRNTWTVGSPTTQGVKAPPLAGPLTDAYFSRMVHVYGTGRPEHTEILKRAAHKGSRGWPLWLWRYAQRVLADSELSAEIMTNAHVVLYATPGSNAFFERIKDRLPIVFEGEHIQVGEKKLKAASLGMKYVVPNPENPDRYIIVQAALNPNNVAAGNNLPDFLPDYVIYDANTLGSRSRLIAQKPYVMQGYFNEQWRVPALGRVGADDSGPDASVPTLKPTTGRVIPYDSRLPTPKPPPVPPKPTAFLAPENDPAGRAARAIVDRASTFYNFRANTPGAEWYIEDNALWSIRSEASCLQALRNASIPFERVADDAKVSWKRFYAPIVTPVPTPVRITGPINGTTFRSIHPGRPVIIACELAAKLPKLVELLKRYDIWMVDVMSSYRPSPLTSFHTFGFALDLSAFYTKKEELIVRRDFVVTPNNLTCMEHPKHGPLYKAPRDATLKRLACELRDSHLFASVLTPNYNEGHRDHFHVDIRPDDPRIFVR